MSIFYFPAWLLRGFSDESERHAEGARTRRGAGDERPARISNARDLLPDVHDAPLVAALRVGDVTALERIVRGSFDELAEFAAGYVRSRDAAEDVAQGVLVRLWEERLRLPETTRLRAYLYTAVRNRALDAIKHERVAARFRDGSQELAEPVDDPPGMQVDDAIDRERDRARLDIALASLTARQREAVLLRYQAQLTVVDVAATLGVSVRAAERLLERSLAVLREAMIGEA